MRIPLTVCPNSNVRIANVFDRLEDHVYPQLRGSGLLATLNTDDPALSDLDLGIEYRSVAAAFGWGWDDMVAIALDGVEACWLDETDKAVLRSNINAAATRSHPTRHTSEGETSRSGDVGGVAVRAADHHDDAFVRRRSVGA